jgi:hypothetical protein
MMGRGLVGAAGDQVKFSLGEFASLRGMIQIAIVRGIPIHDVSPWISNANKAFN